MLSLFSVIPAQPAPELAASLPTVARGEKLCYAFEMYQATIPASQIASSTQYFWPRHWRAATSSDSAAARECGGLLVIRALPVRERLLPILRECYSNLGQGYRCGPSHSSA